MIKERILWGTDDKGVVNVVVDKSKVHIEKSMKKTYDKMYILKKIVLGIIYFKNDENKKGKW